MSLRGQLVTLRQTTADDLRALRPVHNDLRELGRGEDLPYGPDYGDRAIAELERESKEPFTASSKVRVSIVRPIEDGGESFLGCINLWDVNPHQRSVRRRPACYADAQAHIGMKLLPLERGKGLGTDALRLIIEFGFVIRGLHRLTLWTLHDNYAMQRCAVKAGVLREGTLRQAMWSAGAHRDVFIYGILAEDWPGYGETSAE